MKSIVTKFHGPTNTRGARFSASDSDGNRVSVSMDYSIDTVDNHAAAAKALCQKMGWKGTLQAGYIKGGYVFVWINQSQYTV